MSVFCKRCSNCRVHDGSSGSAWAEVTGVALVPKWLVIKLAISISIPRCHLNQLSMHKYKAQFSSDSKYYFLEFCLFSV